MGMPDGSVAGGLGGTLLSKLFLGGGYPSSPAAVFSGVTAAVYSRVHLSKVCHADVELFSVVSCFDLLHFEGTLRDPLVGVKAGGFISRFVTQALPGRAVKFRVPLRASLFRAKVGSQPVPAFSWPRSFGRMVRLSCRYVMLLFHFRISFFGIFPVRTRYHSSSSSSSKTAQNQQRLTNLKTLAYGSHPAH